MTTSLKAVLALVGAAIVGAAIWGAYQYPVTSSVGSSAGTTFSTAKVAETVWTMATGATASSTGNLYNSDSSARIVQDAFYYCTGVDTLTQSAAVWNVAAATSSVSTGIGTNTNYVFNSTIATSSAIVYAASTTPGLTATPAFRVWAPATYLNFQSVATGPATCVIGVHYLAS